MNSFIVAIAQYAAYAVVLVAALVWLRAARADKAGMVVSGVVALVVALVGIAACAAVWTDPRPFVVDHHASLFAHAADNGFPSDHTTLAAAVSFVVMWWRRIVGVALLVVSVAIGAARVLAHVHHVPDILAGVGVGLVAALVGVAVWRLVAPRLAQSRWGASLSGPAPATPGDAAPQPR